MADRPGPPSNTDDRSRARVPHALISTWNRINALNIALQSYEGTVLLVTHDQDLLEEVGTRV